MLTILASNFEFSIENGMGFNNSNNSLQTHELFTENKKKKKKIEIITCIPTQLSCLWTEIVNNREWFLPSDTYC